MERALPLERLTACGLCGGATFLPVRRADPYALVRCAGCGLVFVNPRDPAEATAAQYAGDETSSAAYYERTRPLDLAVYDARLRRIEAHRPPGRLLDIGCSVGTFLAAARSRGWRAEGIEPNPRAAARCREAGHPVRVAPFDETTAEAAATYDVVHLGDVLEHFREPLVALRSAAGCLVPGGLLVATTPNFASRVARAVQVKPREHLYYFTAATLRATVEAAGLRVVELVARGRPRDFAALPLGTSLHGPLLRGAARAIARLRLGGLANWVLTTCCAEELMVIAAAGGVAAPGRGI
jgi:SAM-dependent methyltransferase